MSTLLQKFVLDIQHIQKLFEPLLPKEAPKQVEEDELVKMQRLIKKMGVVGGTTGTTTVPYTFTTTQGTNITHTAPGYTTISANPAYFGTAAASSKFLNIKDITA